MDLRQGTGVTIEYGPFVGIVDGLPMDALAPTDVGMLLSKNGETWVAKSSTGVSAHSQGGFYTTTFDAVDLSDVGRLQFQQVNAGVLGSMPVWHEYDVLHPAAYDNKYLGTNEGPSGGANAVSTGYTVTIGSQSGSYTDTRAINLVYHILSDAAGTIDGYYDFFIGGSGVPFQVEWTGYGTSNNDAWSIEAWNYTQDAWEPLGTIIGDNQGNIQNAVLQLLPDHVGVKDAERGFVLIRVYGIGLSSSNFATDQILVSYSLVYRSVGYVNAAVWINTLGTNTGTEPYEDGTADNPVSTLAAAKQVADAVGLRRMELYPGSIITLNESYEDFGFFGGEIGLGGFSHNRTTFLNVVVTGNADVTGTDFLQFTQCFMQGNQLGQHIFKECTIIGDITLMEPGVILWEGCHTGYAEVGAPPEFRILGVAGAHIFNNRDYRGGLVVNDLDEAGDALVLDGMGGIRIDASCSAGGSKIAGLWDIVNESSGTHTVEQDPSYNIKKHWENPQDSSLQEVDLRQVNQDAEAVKKFHEAVSRNIRCQIDDQQSTPDGISFDFTARAPDTLSLNNDNYVPRYIFMVTGNVVDAVGEIESYVWSATYSFGSIVLKTPGLPISPLAGDYFVII